MKLETYLKQNNLTQSQFARLIDVTPSTVGHYIHNRMIPRPATLEKIEKVTNGQVDYYDFLSTEKA